MAVVSSEEMLEGRRCSGAARESFRYERSFLVRTDAVSDSMVSISNAPGISFGDPHPDDAGVFALRFETQAMSSNPLLYTVRVEYGLPSVEETAADPGATGGGGGGGTNSGTAAPDFTGLPKDIWSGGAGLAKVGTNYLPVTMGGANRSLVRNTAGTMISGIELEQARYTLQLTRCYSNTSFLATIAGVVDKCNNATWAGTPAYTWLCKGARWNRETQASGGISWVYYKVNYEFEHNPNTWDLQIPSVGYQELSGGKLVDIMNGDDPAKPVAEPRGLDASGRAVPPGTLPHTLVYYPYGVIDYQATFGGVY